MKSLKESLFELKTQMATESLFDKDIISKDIDFLSVLTDWLVDTFEEKNVNHWEEKENKGWESMVKKIEEVSDDKRKIRFDTITKMLNIKKNKLYVAVDYKAFSTGRPLVALICKGLVKEQREDLPVILELSCTGGTSTLYVVDIIPTEPDYSRILGDYARAGYRWSEFSITPSGIENFREAFGWFL